MDPTTRGSAFIEKLYTLLTDNPSPEQISWGDSGESFIIQDPIEFSKYLLLEHFKHSNMASFVRQLNKYDFHKVRTIKKPNGQQAWEFVHPKFRKGDSEWIHIKRKETTQNSRKSNNDEEEESELKKRMSLLDEQQLLMNDSILALTAQVRQLSKELADVRHLARAQQATIEQLRGGNQYPQNAYSEYYPPQAYHYPPPQPSYPNQVALSSKARVLLVEDNQVCRAIAIRMLERCGCQFDVAIDGLDAVRKMSSGVRYDLVLMDISMPVLDGVSATSRIREFDRSTPIISLTASTSQRDCHVYSSIGMQDVLPKPFAKDDFVRTLSRWCTKIQDLSLNDDKIREEPDT
ncbi:CheY-like superfamily [Gorgonomyces haynaldii]|nr:CheY-like superfamily [Gorgonomyces haynaldii]